jgi:hypothetical protein
MAARGVLSGVHTIASELIPGQVSAGLFKRVPTLSWMAAKGKTEGKLGRPGGGTLISGNPNLPASRSKSQSGSTQRQIHIHYQSTDAVKKMGLHDTTPSTGTDTQDKNYTTGYVSWTHYVAAIGIRKDVLRMASGKHQIIDAVSLGVEEATEDLIAQVATDIMSGTPSDTTADKWDDLSGLTTSVDSSTAYLNVNRSTYPVWAALEKDAAVVSLNIIDTINNVGDGTRPGITEFGDGGDVFANTMTNYNTLKQEALARGATLTVGSMPQGGEVGFTRESVNYNGVLIYGDPKMTAATGLLLSSGTHHWEVHPGENWRVTQFRDAFDDGAPGERDEITAKISLYCRYWCDKPKLNAKLTTFGS